VPGINESAHLYFDPVHTHLYVNDRLST
jgi:hypothetical protein